MKPFNIEEYLKNPKRKVVTRDGRDVKIICTNFLSNKNVIAEIEKDGYSLSYDENGRNNNFSTPCDLFFAPEKHEGWVNIYEYGRGKYITSEIVYTKKEDAIMGKNKSYLTTIKIEWEE